MSWVMQFYQQAKPEQLNLLKVAVSSDVFTCGYSSFASIKVHVNVQSIVLIKTSRH